MFGRKNKAITYDKLQVAEIAEAQRCLTNGMTLLEHANTSSNSESELRKYATLAKNLLEKTIPRYLEVVPEHVRDISGSYEQIEKLKGLCRTALG